MKSLKTITVLLLTLISTFFGLATYATAQEKSEFTIYMAFWRSCEEACEGFKNYIADAVNICLNSSDKKTDFWRNKICFRG